MRSRKAPRAYHRAAPLLHLAPVCFPSPQQETAVIDGSDRVEFEDVDVFACSDIVILCRINGKDVAVTPRTMLPGTQVARTGDRGRLVLSRAVAVDLELV